MKMIREPEEKIIAPEVEAAKQPKEMWTPAEGLGVAAAISAMIALFTGLIVAHFSWDAGVDFQKDLDAKYPVTHTIMVERPEMSSGHAQARAAELTGRLMDCFGDPQGWQCEPYGMRQGDNPAVPVQPIVTCHSGGCILVPDVTRYNIAIGTAMKNAVTGYNNVEIRGRP